jgi:hypothetical protein
MKFFAPRLPIRSVGLWLLILAAGACRPAGQAEASAPPAIDPAKKAEPEILRNGAVALRLPPGDPHRAELADLAAFLDRSLRAMAVRLPYTGDLAIEIAVEPDYSAQARTHGAVGEAVEAGRAGLALVFDPADRDAYRFAVARNLVARAGGLPSLPPALVDGAALWLSEGWYGRSFEEWLPDLAHSGAFPAAAELLAAANPEDGSPLLATPVAAAWIERRPGKTLIDKLAGGLPAAAALDAQLAVIATSAAWAGTARTPRTSGTSGSAANGSTESRFLRGVSFAMHNSIDGGYHAPSVVQEYARLAELGADAVSLMPFAYQKDPRAPGLKFLDDRPASETGIGLLHAARQAHARGLAVLWKPHLWVRHGWPGEIEMRDEASWAQWWSGYRRYVLHHAFLAAWARAEIFCVGVELDRTAIGPARERAWRELIAAVRVLYPGAVTYAANWDRAPEIPFWDALDFVGVDAYYPLAAAEQVTDAQLAAGAIEIAGNLARLGARARRPVLLTEVGFPSRRAAWREPHAEEGEYDEQDPLRAYNALFAALGRRPWLAGVFVWKSFSDESAAAGRRAGRADFRFLGRRAEAAVRAYFALGAERGRQAP